MSGGGSKLVIVDYQAGNLTSVRLAAERLGFKPLVTTSPEVVRGADRLIFPGVGAAPAAMTVLERSGLGQSVTDFFAGGRPMAGICLGAQIIFQSSCEGDCPCLGLLDGAVEPLKVEPGMKVPHMGWNGVEFCRPHPVWAGVESGAEFYFVHSYAPVPVHGEQTIGRTSYGSVFTSAVAAANLVAFQFHPERSGRIGLRVLQNFLEWNP